MSIIPNELIALYELFNSFESAALFSDDLIEDLPLICILANKDGKVIRVNRFAEEFSYRKKNETVGQSLSSVMSEQARREFAGFFERVTGGDREPLYFVEEADEQYINWKALVLDGPDADTPIIVVLGDDVTETVSLKSSVFSARTVQKALLPTSFSVPGITMRWVYESAEATGGDWFDYRFDEKSSRLFVCICDVNGHGTAAAMVTGCVSGLFHGVMHSLVQTIKDDEELLNEFAKNLNDSIYEILERANRLLTMAAVSINIKTGQGAYVSCGHPRVIQFGDGFAKPLLNRNSPIGIAANLGFESISFKLEPKESLFLYTDGLIENKDSDGRSLSSRELLDNLKKPVSEEIKYNWLRQYAKGLECIPPHNDDTCLITLTRLPVEDEPDEC